MDVRCTGRDDDRGVDTRCVLPDFLDQLVLEDALGNGDADCAAEGLGEDYHCGAGRYEVERENGLYCDERELHAHSYAETSEGLISNPGRVATVGL